MLRENCEITANDNFSEGLFYMRIFFPGVSQKWIPGQFLHILPPVLGNRPPMLRRPVSILSSDGDNVEIVYRVVGEGTRLISNVRVGESLDIIGPLGNGFVDIPESSGKHILIGGGVGAPPMIALARQLHESGKEVEFYQGAKDSSDLILNDDMEKSEFIYFATTEDGSTGHKGMVTDILPAPSGEIAAVYSCGPLPMMKAVLEWRGKSEFKFYVSIENKMGCGVGVCLGCAVPTTNGKYVKVCKSGPVFNADDLDWDKL